MFCSRKRLLRTGWWQCTHCRYLHNTGRRRLFFRAAFGPFMRPSWCMHGPGAQNGCRRSIHVWSGSPGRATSASSPSPSGLRARRAAAAEVRSRTSTIPAAGSGWPHAKRSPQSKATREPEHEIRPVGCTSQRPQNGNSASIAMPLHMLCPVGMLLSLKASHCVQPHPVYDWRPACDDSSHRPPFDSTACERCRGLCVHSCTFAIRI